MSEPPAPAPFGRLPDGRPARLYTLQNRELRVRITDYGGRIVSFEAPDPRRGAPSDIVLGFDDVAAYAAAGGAMGALLGRNANRIARGRFAIDGQHYQAATNDHGSTLHGGPAGFDKCFWGLEASGSEAESFLRLSLVSPDGDQGFPGTLTVHATYRLVERSLWLEFEARTTKPTIVSLSAHPYFNLAGGARGALGHEVTIAADSFLPTDEKQIPTGEIRPVAETPFDFREPQALAARIRQADPQLLHGTGYDHCYALGRGRADRPRFAARVNDPTSGRAIEIHTTAPGLQLYSGNKLDGSVAGRGGIIYRQSAGLALEPQEFPDAPNHPEFPSTVLRPGELYRNVIEYRVVLP